MAIHFDVFPGADAIGRDAWNELAVDASPMMEWEYFHALEDSGAVHPDRGYRPCHLMASAGDRPIALAPLYERDRAWVEFGDGGLIEFLTELTGIPFHKGLVGMIPYTPVPAYEFLHRRGTGVVETARLLLNYIDYLCEKRGLITCRLYFISNRVSPLHDVLRESGFVNLKSEYSLWFNRGYHCFEDYLASFKSSRRTKIKRELRTIEQQGIEIRMVPGTDAPSSYFTGMYRLYRSTWTKHMGNGIRPFLNEKFFMNLAENYRERISFWVASQGGRDLAMALFYGKGGSIYGRYWGCFEEVPFLHFATCYYRPIEYAIEHGIQTVDPGFGGEHKLIRGFEVVPVEHYIKFYGERNRRVAYSILEQMRNSPM